MKTCSYCGLENEGPADACGGCGCRLPISPDAEGGATSLSNLKGDSKLAQKLLGIHATGLTYVTFLRLLGKQLFLKLLPIGALSVVLSGNGFTWALAFGIGGTVAILLIDICLFEVFRRKWALVEAWTDWEAVERLAGIPAPAPEANESDSSQERADAVQES
jgi:hypothetical protein